MRNNRQNTSLGKAEAKPDQYTLDALKEILNILARAVSAMKLFPSDHSTVKKFRYELTEKLSAYLDEHWKLEVEVQEKSFLYQGEIVHKEDNLVKSLPYFFYKDGMRRLFFRRGLTPQELEVFLEVVKKDTLTSPEENDAVMDLWEKEFENIGFTAPDTYLEARIETRQKKPVDFSVDRTQFATGKIKLDAADMEDVYKRSLAFQLKKQAEFLDMTDLTATLDKKEKQILDKMLEQERKVSSQKEFSDVLFELLHLEEKSERFQPILEFLEKHHLDLIQKGDFFHALYLSNQIKELKGVLSYTGSWKATELEKFMLKLKEQNSENLLKEIALNGQVTDPFYFFEYLKLLGPKMIPLAADLFEDVKEPEFRSDAFAFLQEMSQKNLDLLLPLASDQKPLLTRAIIALLSTFKDKKSISLFAVFHKFQNRAIQLEAIQALGRIKEDMANKVLIGFLHEEDAEVRISAAENLHSSTDKSLVSDLIQIAAEKTFYERSPREKIALMNILGQSRTEEALSFLQSLLEKTGPIPKGKQEETRLYAVQALEAMATSKAREILLKGTKDENKKISHACQEALQRISSDTGTHSS
ncbi:MAG: HEAT repeat domain-containing protein [Candidatus Aminicenantales bacterium]